MFIFLVIKSYRIIVYIDNRKKYINCNGKGNKLNFNPNCSPLWFILRKIKCYEWESTPKNGSSNWQERKNYDGIIIKSLTKNGNSNHINGQICGNETTIIKRLPTSFKRVSTRYYNNYQKEKSFIQSQSAFRRTCPRHKLTIGFDKERYWCCWID